jgi:hypothetical protein
MHSYLGIRHRIPEIMKNVEAIKGGITNNPQLAGKTLIRN